MQMLLTIDDDVLAAAEERAAAEQKTVDEVLSAFVRRGMPQTPEIPKTRNGVVLLTGGHRVTSELVRQLQEELE